jgi:hypothetical protein
MVSVLTEIAANQAEANRILAAILGGAVREQRESLKRRLLAAGVSPARTEDLLCEAIDSVPRDAWCRARHPGRLLVKALDAALERDAKFLKRPYRALLAALERQWANVHARMAEAGLSGTACENLLLTVACSFSEEGWETRPRQPLDRPLVERVEQVCAERRRRELGQAPGPRPDRILLILENVAQAQARRREVCQFFTTLDEIIGSFIRDDSEFTSSP